MSQETYHKVGEVEYKLDHENKKVLHKQVYSLPRGQVEETWRETGADYETFKAKYGDIAEAPAPVLEESLEKRIVTAETEPVIMSKDYFDRE